jgi:hypothetical protein
MKTRAFGKIISDSDDRFVVHFRGFVEGGGPDPEVSLARNGDHCYFTVSNLASHDSHSPGFDCFEDAADYRTRVLEDIGKSLKQRAIASVGFYQDTNPAYVSF